MKPAADKSERTKMIALMAIVGITLVYVLVFLVIKPRIAQWKSDRAQYAELDTRLSDARKEIRQVQSERTTYQNALRRIENQIAAGNRLIRPRLGNYRIGAEAILQAWADASHVKLTDINEVGLQEFPQPGTRASRNALRGYVVRVTLSAGFADLLQLLDRVEAANPLACVVRMEVTAQESTPLQHAIMLEIQWPTLGMGETMGRVEERIQANEHTGQE